LGALTWNDPSLEVSIYNVFAINNVDLLWDMFVHFIQVTYCHYAIL